MKDEVQELKMKLGVVELLAQCRREHAVSELVRPGLAWEERTGTEKGRSWLARRLRQLVWKPVMRLGVLLQHESKPLVWEPLPAAKPGRVASPLPRIAVVTPSFNQAEFLERTLKSVLDQNYPDLEYVVMDGGSTDGSPDIIARYADRLHHWQSGKDGGHSAAIADGFRRTTGEIMAWLNSDDIWPPGLPGFVADYFRRHPEVGAVYGHRVLIDEVDREVGRWILPPHDVEFTRWADYIPQETLFWRREVFEKAGGMDPAFRFSMDWDLILRLQKTQAAIVRLPWLMGAFRVHAAQKSQTQIHTVAVEENARLRARELGSAFHQSRLEERSILFQARALRYHGLRQLGFRL